MSASEHWHDEKQSAYLYRVIAEVEPAPAAKDMFLALSKAADEQASIWAAKANPAALHFTPSARARLVAQLVRTLGARRIRPALAAMKVRGLSVFSTEIPVGHAMPKSRDDFGQRHRSVGAGGALRAAVFGVNDGLVSNASLILGVAGAGVDARAIVLAGLAGLLAGAFSMAAGEYISVRSQRELFEYQIGLERDELDEYPDEEAEEIALIYRARGLELDEARTLARRMMKDPENALDTLAREELGLNPDDLGSPWRAALWSFVAFAIGAALPLIPLIAAPGAHALMASIAITALALFGIGAVLALFTGRSAWLNGLRMLAIGSAAGAATWSVGRLFGVAVQ